MRIQPTLPWLRVAACRQQCLDYKDVECELVSRKYVSGASCTSCSLETKLKLAVVTNHPWDLLENVSGLCDPYGSVQTLLTPTQGLQMPYA